MIALVLAFQGPLNFEKITKSKQRTAICHTRGIYLDFKFNVNGTTKRDQAGEIVTGCPVTAAYPSLEITLFVLIPKMRSSSSCSLKQRISSLDSTSEAMKMLNNTNVLHGERLIMKNTRPVTDANAMTCWILIVFCWSLRPLDNWIVQLVERKDQLTWR